MRCHSHHTIACTVPLWLGSWTVRSVSVCKYFKTLWFSHFIYAIIYFLPNICIAYMQSITNLFGCYFHYRLMPGQSCTRQLLIRIIIAIINPVIQANPKITHNKFKFAWKIGEICSTWKLASLIYQIHFYRRMFPFYLLPRMNKQNLLLFSKMHLKVGKNSWKAQWVLREKCLFKYLTFPSGIQRYGIKINSFEVIGWAINASPVLIAVCPLFSDKMNFRPE